MTTTLPIPARPTIKTLSQNMAKGTLVRVANETGVFRISSPAGWGGPDNATATCYNLLGPYGRCVSAVPARIIHALTTDEARDAEVRWELDQPAPPRIQPVLARMLRHPELTLRLGSRLLGRETAEALSLEILAKHLLPKYKRTHCWACKTSLDNLRNETCPKCGGIQCGCGGCRCNWPYPPQTAYRRHDFTSPADLTALHLPR